jgi:ribonucleoside-diphosphate reductase alpha chain
MKPRHTAEQSTVTVNKSEVMGKVGFAALRKKIVPATQIPSPISVSDAMPVHVPAPITSMPVKVCPVDPQERLQCDSCQ